MHGQQSLRTGLRQTSSQKASYLGHTAFSHAFARVALVAIAGLAGTGTAHASMFWFDDEPAIIERAPLSQPKRQPKQRQSYPKLPSLPKQAAKPQGPLLVNISLGRQTIKVYDDNGLFAESAVSTGMRGHTTPTGIYSVIQKSKWHRSNIYSDAPMPFMQRMTWSGIAIHAGALPGYPASHGCVRIPMSFAVQIWDWTRMGARIVVTSSEITPIDFAHRLLPISKPVAEDAPMAATDPASPAAARSGGTDHSDTGSELTFTNLKLRPSLQGPAILTTGPTATALRAQTYLADASVAMPDLSSTAIASDAPASQLRSASFAAGEQSTDAGNNERSLLAVSAAEPADSTEVVTGSILPKDAAPAVDVPGKSTSAKSTGRIAAFISRKDRKLYVRQNFEPLFDVPVTIADSERPLGTYLFTAMADKSAPDTLRWTVMTLPTEAQTGQSASTPAARRKRNTAAIATPDPAQPTPTEALDRITIPEESMRQLAELLAPGGSIIVSDQGIAASRETGRGTDFIVSLK